MLHSRELRTAHAMKNAATPERLLLRSALSILFLHSCCNMASRVLNDEAGDDDEEGGAVRRLRHGLLTFQQDATEELLQHDGLSVFGRGLGMCTVAAALLAVHHHASQSGESGGAVIMIGKIPSSGVNAACSCRLVCRLCIVPYRLVACRFDACTEATYSLRAEAPGSFSSAYL